MWRPRFLQLLALGLLGVSFSPRIVAAPLQGATFASIRTSPLDPWGTSAPLNQPITQITTWPDTLCVMRVDADAGSPEDAPARTPSNRIGYSAAIQCTTQRARVTTAPSIFLGSNQTSDTVTKQIVDLRLIRTTVNSQLDPLYLTNTTPVSSVSGAATAADLVHLSGTYRSDTLEYATYQVRATVELTDNTKGWNSTYSYGYRSPWFAVTTSSGRQAYGERLSDCQNVDGFLGTISPWDPTNIADNGDWSLDSLPGGRSERDKHSD